MITARRWLVECTETHAFCASQNIEERPTRLIDISGSDIKLVLTSGWKNMPRYATLSYCWGAGNFLKLVSDNLQNFMSSIPSTALPRTYTCAIDICRKLNIEYIWIDALCIIQDKDNGEDWLRESGRMRSIYGQSYLNLASASAASPHEEIVARMSAHSGGFYAQVEDDERCKILAFHSETIDEEATAKTILASRAWALQERLLAPRTLYFSEKGFFWECRTTVASEFLPYGIPDALMPLVVLPDDKPWPWNTIVRLYSGASLTEGMDKLPALAGIARRQHENTGD